jgi:hypothetical protein
MCQISTGLDVWQVVRRDGGRWTGSGWPTRDYYRTPNNGSDPNSGGNVRSLIAIFVHIGIGKVGKLFSNQGNPLF